MYTYETKPAFKPILVFCFPTLTMEQRAAIAPKLEQMVRRMRRSGQIYFILDGFDKMDIRAFGVPESQFGELKELKKLIEQSIKQSKMENKEYKNIFTIEAATLSLVEDARLYVPKRVLSIELILVISSEFDKDELEYVLEPGKQVKIIVVE